MYASEDTEFFKRQYLGSQRGFQMHITDTLGRELIRLDRPFNCYAQEMEVHGWGPPDTVIGKLQQDWNCCNLRYEVLSFRDHILWNQRLVVKSRFLKIEYSK